MFAGGGKANLATLLANYQATGDCQHVLLCLLPTGSNCHTKRVRRDLFFPTS